MIKNIIQGQQVDPIGLISDLFDAIQYLNEPQNLSDNLLQVYNPYKDKYLQWISDIGVDTLFSSPFADFADPVHAFQRNECCDPVNSQYDY